MKWFDKWFDKKCREAWENSRKSREEDAIRFASVPIGLGKAIESNSFDTYPDLTFKMYKAYNGIIMEVRHVDRKTERNSTNMHLIADGADLGDSISKIITLESLRIS